MAARSNTQILERKRRYVGVVEKHTLNDDNTTTLMKHKYRCDTRREHAWMCTRTVAMFSTVVYSCDEFQADLFKSAWAWEAAKDEGTLRLQTSRGQSFL